jgi:hypothetical protein
MAVIHSHQDSKQLSYSGNASTSDLDKVLADESIPPSISSRKRSRDSSLSSNPEISAASAKKAKVSCSKEVDLESNQQLSEQKEEQVLDDKDSPVEEIFPPWQTLPCHILTSIFHYANGPSIEFTGAWNPHTTLRIFPFALLCKSFVEPVLSSVYHEPWLYPPPRAQRLTANLESQTSNSWLNYRAKVKYLRIKYAMEYSGLPPVDFGRLIAVTPRLQGIKIQCNSLRTEYEQLFEALETNHINLREWKWEPVIFYDRWHVENISGVLCLHPLFHTFERLVFCDDWEFDFDPQDEAGTAAAVNGLTRLRELVINLAHPEALLLLPTDLVSLHLMRCRGFDPDALPHYLAARGRKLRYLVLDEFSLCDLSFLANLALSCPELEVLKADFTPSGRSNPSQQKVMRPHEKPTWPLTLRHLEILNLSGWMLSSSELFFSSLVDSASSLPKLRHINIQSSFADGNYLSRVRFGNKWTGRLMHVFSRPFQPPNPHLRSFGAFRAFKEKQKSSGDGLTIKSSHHTSPGLCQITSRHGSDQVSPGAVLPGRSGISKELNEEQSGGKDGEKIDGKIGDDNDEKMGYMEGDKKDAKIDEKNVYKNGDNFEDSDDDYLNFKETYEGFHVQGLCEIVRVDIVDEEFSDNEDYNAARDFLRQSSEDEDSIPFFDEEGGDATEDERSSSIDADSQDDEEGEDAPDEEDGNSQDEEDGDYQDEEGGDSQDEKDEFTDSEGL